MKKEEMKKIGKARKLYKNEKAVSPVIGVILMVAITVILAAIIGMHVFGMVDSVPETKIVSIYGYRSDETTVNFVVTGIDPIGVNITNIAGTGDIDEDTPTVGTEFSSEEDVSVGTRVVLVATFADGASQVVYTSKL